MDGQGAGNHRTGIKDFMGSSHDGIPNASIDPLTERPAKTHPHESFALVQLKEMPDVLEKCDGNKRTPKLFCASLNDCSANSEVLDGTPISSQPGGRVCVSAKSSCDSIAEPSSDFSVEVIEPLNATIARARALHFYHSSSWVLHVYHSLKHAAQQRTYRRYYGKWLRFLLRRPLTTAGTPTSLENLSSVSDHAVPLLACDPPDTALDVSASLSAFFWSERRESCGVGNGGLFGRELTELHNEHRGGRQLLLLSTKSVVLPLMHDPTKHSTRLRSRSRPSLLSTHGQKSSPPGKAALQLSIFPCTRLPLLAYLGNLVSTIHYNAIDAL